MTNEDKEEYLKKCTGCLSCKYFLGEDKYGWGHCLLRENADTMFEELGYMKTKDEKIYIEYTKITNAGTESIYFLDKEVAKDFNFDYGFITIPELKAINEKVKELGWYD